VNNLKRLGKGNILGFITCTFLFLSFVIYQKKQPVTKEMQLSYITNLENGLFKSDSIDHLKYVIYYKPAQLVIQSNAEPDNLNFTLKCSYFDQDLLGDLQAPYNYTRVINNLSFHLKDFVYGVYDETDTVSLNEFAYARTFGSSNSSDALLVFDKKDEFDQFEIYVSDFVFEKHQGVQFTFQNSDIENCPVINLK
jgi:hypothetical protein